MKILALMKYGDLAASTRQRLLQYGPVLGETGIALECVPLLDNHYLNRFNRGERISAARVAAAYVSRLRTLLGRRDFDALWVYLEAFPYLPGFVERLALRSGKPVIFDLDDAIFHQYDQHRSALVRKVLGRKLEPLLRGAALCLCGNDYLCDYAGRFCQRCEILPTVVDTAVLAPGRRQSPERGVPVIGWIGSPSTWPYVKPVAPLCSALAQEGLAQVRIVGARNGSAPEGFQLVDWSEASEVAELQGMDIGIMPLPEDPWARGKCGYKLIQYMACGLPVVASPVGVNREIVEQGVNGFLAVTAEEWEGALRALLADPDLRLRMGQAGRRKVEERYSLQVTGPRLVALLQSVIEMG
jgi:glycosyltransferase involved in cell wall biosynthesis